MIHISAAIITFNEEHNIARCIESLQGIVDEIIVLDSFSADNTVAIAESLGATVYQHSFTGYGVQKNKAFSYAKHDWILNIDADESLSLQLAKSIIAIKNAPPFYAYRFNILTNFCGKWIKHCGLYPASKTRLWNKNFATMNNNKVHEGVCMNKATDETGFLKGDLLHYSYRTIADYSRKIEKYSEIGARFDVERGKKCSLFKLLIVPKWEFLNMFIFRLGFLDGYSGYLICRLASFGSFLKYAKIRQYGRLKS